MPEQVVYCFHCQSKNTCTDKIHFRDQCEKCSADLHICRNCMFYDEGSYNECKESSAERVTDKETKNVCEYFMPLSTLTSKQDKKDLLKQAEALFKKK